MKFGMNLLLWSGELSDELLPTIDSLKKMGYDGVEVPLFNLDLDYADWGRRLDELGLQRTAVTIRTAADNPISPEASVRQRGIEETKRAIDCCAQLGATHLVGPFHSALGEFSGAGPTEDEWKWGVESMRPVAEHAATASIMLGMEALNRFETYLLNTVDDAARFARDVDHANCKIMYDTFHSHIEEKDIRAAIVNNGEMICHIHISENDRSTPGAGIVRWKENFDAIRDINFQDWLVVEAFGQALPELAAATKIWRRMYDTEERLAWDSLEFMKEQVAARV